VGNSDDRPVVHRRFDDDVDFSLAQGALQARQEPDPAMEGPIPGTKSRPY
jgi:hypothetical protein